MSNSNRIACRLSLPDYGTVPSTSWVEARNLTRGFSVVYGAEPECVPRPRRAAVTKKRYNWRLFAKFLLQIPEGWIDEDAYRFVQVEGETGIRADALILAWGLQQDIVNWLCKQTDEGIQLLESQFGSLFATEPGNEIVGVCTHIKSAARDISDTGFASTQLN